MIHVKCNYDISIIEKVMMFFNYLGALSGWPLCKCSRKTLNKRAWIFNAKGMEHSQHSSLILLGRIPVTVSWSCHSVYFPVVSLINQYKCCWILNYWIQYWIRGWILSWTFVKTNLMSSNDTPMNCDLVKKNFVYIKLVLVYYCHVYWYTMSLRIKLQRRGLRLQNIWVMTKIEESTF